MKPNIVDNCEIAMTVMIAAMTVEAGYNFNWSSVENEEDLSIGPNFPRNIINPTDGLADNEKNNDEKDGKSSNDYTNDVLFVLLTAVQLDDPKTNPNFEIRSVCRHALDDLKRLFGSNFTLNNNCDYIMYQSSRIEYIKRNDPQRPAQLRSVWKISYSQDRNEPSQFASS